MKTELLCGEKKVGIELPSSTTILEMKKLEALPNPEDAVHDALNHPMKSPPLEDLARNRKNACVVISDFTRPVPNKIILPPLLQALEKSGVSRENITILIATGMHRPNLGEELISLVGKDIVDNYTIINHYCRRKEEYRKIDEIEGAPIEINKYYLDADLKILTGLIEPHFYAGYSGGRKAILPGISSFETMKFMHSYKMIDNPDVTNLMLDQNPFHKYGIRVAELAGADFILNVVINKERQIAGVFAGHYDHAHLAGCEMVYKHSAVKLPKRFDMVITSGGGYPLDATFYQVSKALVCAKDVLSKGGIIVVLAECREGLGGKEFSSILRTVSSPQEFFKDYSDPNDFVIDQWCAQSIYQTIDHAGELYIYSDGLPLEDVKSMGAVKIDNVQKTIDELLTEKKNVVAIPDGPYVVGIAD
jgi:lactate racemase